MTGLVIEMKVGVVDRLFDQDDLLSPLLKP
jgi:hypothetical protein